VRSVSLRPSPKVPKMHYQMSILEPNVKIPAPTDAKNGAQYSRASNTSGQPSHFYAASLRSQSAVRWFSSSAIPRHFFPARHFHFSPSILLVQAHKALGLMPAKGPSALYRQCWRCATQAAMACRWARTGAEEGVLDLLCGWLPVLLVQRRDERCGAGCSASS